MWSWETLSILAGIFASGGVLADRLLLNRQKGHLQLLLTRWWCRLDETKTPNFVRVVSGWFLQFGARMAGRDGSTARGVVVIGTVSFVLTSAALLFGNLWAYDWEFTIESFLWRLSNLNVFMSLYLPNLLFDFATVLITVLIVRKIHRYGFPTAIGWIATDIFFAGVLAVACVTVGIGAVDIFVLNQAPELKENFYAWYSGLLAVFMPSASRANPAYVNDALYSLTTLIPTALFLGFLLVCGVAKLVAHGGIRISSHVLEKATEGKPENLLVFTMLGMLVGVIGLIAKAIHHFVTLGQIA